jgi:hypothetical protein
MLWVQKLGTTLELSRPTTRYLDLFQEASVIA